LSVLRLQSATASNDKAPRQPEQGLPWPEDLPPLHWVQQVGPLKPTAEVLAQAQQATARGRPLPLVMRMRYGSGQSVYVATDETWRWRYGRGELYFQQFWIQLLRMLGFEPDDPHAETTEQAIISMGVMARLEALGTLQRIFSSAVAVVGENEALQQKALTYQREFSHALTRATVLLDRDGDGRVDERRGLSSTRLVRV